MKTLTTKFALSLAIALTLLQTQVLGQSGTGILTGTVTDKTGALIAKAHIVLTDAGSGIKRETEANQDGFFSLVGVPAAVYDIEASAKGFKPLRRTGIEVHISDQLAIKGLVLEVAGISETMTVSSEAAEITPSTSGEVSVILTDSEIHNLNVAGRSAIELLGLIPGAGNTGNFNGTYNSQQAGFTQNASTFTVNGNRFDQVQITSDGAAVTDLNTAGSAAVTPNVEMISELKVQSAAYSAAEPNGPIVVSTDTKAGTNHYHGEGYLTARNHALNAADWQQLANGLPPAQTSLYYAGAQVGGPIKKDKLFFFLATELAQQHVDQGVRHSAVPDALMRQGNFTEWSTLASFSTAANNYRYWGAAAPPV